MIDKLDIKATDTEKISSGLWMAATFSNKEKRDGNSSVFTALLFAFVVFFLLVTLLTGISVYRAINDARVGNDDTRLALSLIANSVKMNDSSSAVGVGNGPEGRSLVLTEKLDTGIYETRIYAFEGKIVQEYSVASSAYDTDRAKEITESEVFDFEYNAGLLTVHTDQGSVDIALHSVGGGL